MWIIIIISLISVGISIIGLLISWSLFMVVYNNRALNEFRMMGGKIDIVTDAETYIKRCAKNNCGNIIFLKKVFVTSNNKKFDKINEAIMCQMKAIKKAKKMTKLTETQEIKRALVSKNREKTIAKAKKLKKSNNTRTKNVKNKIK